MPPLLQQFWEKINDWLSLNDQVKIEIEGSVGQGGVNKLTDLVKIAQRLHDLNFYKPILPSKNKSVFKEGDFKKGTCPLGLIKAIKVFQAATKPQGTFSGIDGKVDPNYSTIKKLRSHLAPKWVHFQTIIENKEISQKICCITNNSKKNWCASWTAEFLLQLTDDWFAKKEKSYPDEVWKLKITSLSDRGGSRLSKATGKPIGKTHKSGINADFRIFTKYGRSGNYDGKDVGYLRGVQKKFLEVLKDTKVDVNGVEIGIASKPLFNDKKLIGDLRQSSSGHDDHVHIQLTYEPKNWWTETDVNEISAKPTALILNQNILDVKPALSFDPDTGGNGLIGFSTSSDNKT